jgi:NADH-quinone oxidoreductase subunit C
MAWAEEVAAAFDAAGFDGAPTYDEGFGPLTVTVAATHWTESLTVARDTLGCTFFDWLSAVDELAEGFAVVCHLARHRRDDVQHLLLRTTLPREEPSLPSAVGVFAGASWHERETTEMFGIRFLHADRSMVAAGGESDRSVVSDFAESADVVPTRHLLLPEEFEGHPLRKDFVLVSRVAKPWPGAKEPGESEEGGSPSRRRTRPPGVPEPEAWGPREPGSPVPDPLAHAQPGAARPRRAPRQRPAPEQAEQTGQTGQPQQQAQPEKPEKPEKPGQADG